MPIRIVWSKDPSAEPSNKPPQMQRSLHLPLRPPSFNISENASENLQSSGSDTPSTMLKHDMLERQGQQVTEVIVEGRHWWGWGVAALTARSRKS